MTNVSEKWAVFEELDGGDVVVYGIGTSPDESMMDAIGNGMLNAEPCHNVVISDEIFRAVEESGGGVGSFEFDGETLIVK